MEWSIIGINLLYAVLGVVLMYASFRVVDKLMPEISFTEELKHGNIAVAVFVSALFLSIAIIIAGALN
jgi:uncharacterized membrane protein YjfL (UPF0719 family)